MYNIPLVNVKTLFVIFMLQNIAMTILANDAFFLETTHLFAIYCHTNTSNPKIHWIVYTVKPEFSDILWHPTKMYGPKEFL